MQVTPVEWVHFPFVYLRVSGYVYLDQVHTPLYQLMCPSNPVDSPPIPAKGTFYLFTRVLCVRLVSLVRYLWMTACNLHKISARKLNVCLCLLAQTSTYHANSFRILFAGVGFFRLIFILLRTLFRTWLPRREPLWTICFVDIQRQPGINNVRGFQMFDYWMWQMVANKQKLQ